MEVSWPGDFGEIHTKILRRMKQILEEDTVYPYLKENAVKRLNQARATARATGMLEHSLVHLGGYSWCLFPWLGTRSFRTLRKYIKKNAAENNISGIEFEGCYYITFKMEKVSDIQFISRLLDGVEREGIICEHLVENSEIPVFEKYDPHIPADLLRHAYAVDRLDLGEARKRLLEIRKETLS